MGTGRLLRAVAIAAVMVLVPAGTASAGSNQDDSERLRRAVDARHATVLEKLGADLVVLPSRDMAYRLAERLRDNAGSDRQELSGDYQLAQVRLGPPLHGQTLAEAALRERYRINVVLLTRPGPGQRTEALEPNPDLRMALHDLLIVAGLRTNINRFERECGLPE